MIQSLSWYVFHQVFLSRLLWFFVLYLGFHALERIYLVFLFFRTIGIYFELEYLQVYRQKFHLPPAYAYCTILYFHHYEFLFPELLSYFLNYWSFCFFSLLKWFRESYAEFANLIFEKIENLFCLLSFKMFKIYIFLSSLRKLSFREIDLLNTHRSKPRPSSLDKDVLIATDEWSLMKLSQTSAFTIDSCKLLEIKIKSSLLWIKPEKCFGRKVNPFLSLNLTRQMSQKPKVLIHKIYWRICL